jgi:hypothetical protein
MKQIKTLQALRVCADNRQSVICPDSRCWNRPRPAAFMINQIGCVLLTLFLQGMYVYEPKKKVKKSIRKGFKV